MKGLEPLSLSAPDPKSGAATNYATSAGFACLRQLFFNQENKQNYKNVFIKSTGRRKMRFDNNKKGLFFMNKPF